MHDKKLKRFLLGALLLAAGVFGVSLFSFNFLLASPVEPALAAPAKQIPIYTPTPLPDGRIIYIVQAGDTLLSISLKTGVPEDEIRKLNNISGDLIVEGQKLLLGLAGPAQETSTPGPSPTPTTVLPTPTAKPGSGDLCILLFNDYNGDSIRQESEPSIPNGAISLTNRSGTVSKTAKTATGTDPYCFEKVPEGDYNISVAVPEGYNPTTVMNYAVQLKAGDQTYLDFGAQVNSATMEEAPVPTGSGRSPLLGILGGVLLLAGAGLAIFAGRLLKSG
jgi:hypothetical protein